MEKLKSAEEQLEKQGKVLEQATARSLELESMHETVARDFELKHQEAAAKFSSRDSEVQSLYEKIKTLEDQARTYEEQITEATERSEAVKHELEQVLLKLSLSENTTEDFKNKISETEDRAAEVMSENELLTETNIQLKKRINDLEELLNSASTDKEATIQQLASHINTITELADKHARASEMQLAAESRISETETKLEEAIQNVAKKELEAKHLMEKLNSLRDQVKAYEEQAHDTSSLAESLKVRLEQTHTTLRDQEGTMEELKSKSIDLEEERARLLEVNSELTEKLASYEPKVIDLETKLAAAFVERNEAVDELQASKTVVANLTQDINSERQKLQLQLSSALEENKQLREMYESSEKKLQGVIAHLEEQLNEHASSKDALKSQVEVLTADISQKSELQNLVKELEEQLASAKAQFKQQKELDTEKEMDRESSIKELQAKKNEVSLLENKVKELEQKLQLGDAARLKEKDVGGSSTDPKEDVEVKSRDIGSMVSTPSKRKSKKKSEASATQAASTDTQVRSTNEAASPFTAQFILGVADRKSVV